MKPVVSGGRAIPSQKYLRGGLPCAALREFVPLSDLTETLLCAYDGVARAAYEKFLDRGARVGGELEDWLEAEQEVLCSLRVDVAESAGFVSALASLPGYRSTQITLGIEPRWLLIFGCRESEDGADTPGLTRSLDPLRGPPRMDAAALAVMCAHAARVEPPARTASMERSPSHLFCIMELPAEVDPLRCSAILSKGLLGIHMSKARARKINLGKPSAFSS
jgi:HSP20 family molecular chaperone IbpA